MSPLALFEQLAESPWSIALHESEIAYSIIESVHVWTMALFFGLVGMFDLRLLGWVMRSVPVSEVVGRLRPWTIAAFVVMVATGTLLVLAIPVRSYQSLFFRARWGAWAALYPKRPHAGLNSGPRSSGSWFLGP